MSRVIGLTGGIATGKTTVARMIRRRGIPVICADDLARQAVKKGSPGLKKITRTFGPEMLTRKGELNRPGLARIVFANPHKRKQLNRIVHPYVVKEMKKVIAKNRKKPVIVLDVPLLFEERLDRLCEKTVVVYAPAALQKKRLKKRNRLENRAITNRLKSQMPIAAKRNKADFVIDNSKTVTHLQKQISQFLQELHSPLLEFLPPLG
ncbi:MAG: dephospho-CoA kinase [Deltaproteobacteria bacterium]|nr:dephospho-CoA kinase [Deltaproteobacteria bacterium]